MLLSGDQRAFAHRFGRGAGRFFARFVRAGLLALLAAALLTSLAAGPLFALSAKLGRESGLELATHAVFSGALFVAGLLLLLALLALDAAPDPGSRARTPGACCPRWAPALRSALRHPLQWLGDLGT